MLRRSIVELKAAHPGSDIWVIASGPSMGFVAPSFFEGKITLGINGVYKKFRCTFLLRKEQVGAEEAYQTGIPLILSEHDCGSYLFLRNSVSGPAWYFTHKHNRKTKVDLSVIGTDRLVVSYSTVTSGLHMAAYMGARNIILCGHDCGTLDGQLNFEGYYDGVGKAGTRGDPAWYREWLTWIEPQTLAVCERLKKVYQCNIHSLNPFINLGLEGHHYSK